MRTNIEINDYWIKEAMKFTDVKVKKDIVNQALEELVKNRRKENFKKLQGMKIWEGDLEKMRTYDKWAND